MSNWRGYFLKSLKTGEIFPMKYIQWDTWDSEPNHREEVRAYRDDYTRELYRYTASGTKSSFAFSVRDNLHLNDVEIIKSYFDRSQSNSLERKATFEYWNDEDLDYKTGEFYLANMNFKIKKATGNDLIYQAIKLDFVEY